MKREDWDWPGGWRPSLGAWIDEGGVRFRVWAPEASEVAVVLEGEETRELALDPYPDGTWGLKVADLVVDSLYRYRIDGRGPFPDPASRFQPHGVHGPSSLIDPHVYSWREGRWTGVSHADLIIYELHLGTFTNEGTYQSAAERLHDLADLGVTAIELMPLWQFPGERNWGYDGVSPFAPASCYGPPDDLRALVDRAHGLGLAVLLDVVYNHFGPEGNYVSQFSPYYFSDKHQNPWGKGLNFDGPHSEMVRAYFIENALHWLHEYRMDGLRLDATHAIIDTRSRHFVTELTARVRESIRDRHVSVIAEDHRNLAHMVKGEEEGGWALSGVWADDFHHKVRVALAGDKEGYYADFTGSMSDLARTLNEGWFFQGQHSEYLGEPRGTDPTGIPPRRFVFCLQNHDQIGNRALGERLHHLIDLAAFRAASVLMLCAPATPLLFMGQEWAASSPFLYFTDHPEELGRLVTEGRRREFRHFRMFADPDARNQIPDPQAESTFLASKLQWDERDREPHSSVLRLYRTLISLRLSEPAIRHASSESFEAFALDEHTLLLRQDAEVGPSLIALIQMQGSGEHNLLDHPCLDGLDPRRCSLVLTTEDPPYASDSQAPRVELFGDAPVVEFKRPSAVLLRAWPTLKA